MLTKQEFEDIVLQSYELKNLKHFGKHITLGESPCNALLEFGLVAQDSDIIGLDGEAIPSGPYSITEKGINYLEYRRIFGWRRVIKYVVDNWIGLTTLILTAIMLLKSCSAG